MNPETMLLLEFARIAESAVGVLGGMTASNCDGDFDLGHVKELHAALTERLDAANERLSEIGKDGAK